MEKELDSKQKTEKKPIFKVIHESKNENNEIDNPKIEILSKKEPALSSLRKNVSDYIEMLGDEIDDTEESFISDKIGCIEAICDVLGLVDLKQLKQEEIYETIGNMLQGAFKIRAEFLLPSPNFSGEEEYFKTLEKSGVKNKVVIVGSGRGDVDGRRSFSKTHYGEKAQYNFLLVNIDKEAFPDIISDIKWLDKSLSNETYDMCLFENVDITVAFTKEAIWAGLRILKSKGQLITSSFPTLLKKKSSYKTEEFIKEKALCSKNYKLLGGYYLGFKENGNSSLYILSEEPEKVLTPEEFYSFNMNGILQCFGIYNMCSALFMRVKPGSDYWPSSEGMSIKKLTSIKEKSYKSVIIFTKK